MTNTEQSMGRHSTTNGYSMLYPFVQFYVLGAAAVLPGGALRCG
jgi:hypothetical protein